MLRGAVESAVQSRLQSLGEIFPRAVDAVHGGTGWAVRAQVVGARLSTLKDVRAIEKQVGAEVGERIRVSVLARTEVVVTGSRYQPLGPTPPEEEQE